MTVLNCWDFSFLIGAAAFAGLRLGIRTRALLPRSGFGREQANPLKFSANAIM